MRVIIAYSPDPIYISPYILKILQRHHSSVVGVVQTRGSITKRGTLFAQLEYFFALTIIIGLQQTVKNFVAMVSHRFRSRDLIEEFCISKGIPIHKTKTVNASSTREFMRSLNCDLIFNQSQHIVRKQILEIPKIGVLNRHGAYLPKYRGRLAPFWQIYHGETFGGLTYHLLNENIDDGPIVYQEKLPISRHEDVNSLIEKMFAAAVDKFGTVLQLLERPDASEYLIDNPSELATYYSSPRLVHAIRYRLQRLGVGRGAKA